MKKNEVSRGILLLCSFWCISASAQVIQPKVVLPDALVSPVASPLFCEKGVEYKPLPHFDAPTYSDGIPENGVQKQYAWPKTTAEINAKLPNIATEIGVTNFSASGTIAGIFGLSKNSKSIVIDFIKYRSEPMQSSSASTPSAYARVGVGMRLHLELSDVKADFAGSLMSLAAGVKGGNIKGTISAELMGIDSPDITQSMPFTSDLSDASIQRVIEAMAIVKSRLSDDKANLRPQLLARITCKQ